MDDIQLCKAECYIIDGFNHHQKWYIKKVFDQYSLVEIQPSNLQINSQHEVFGKLTLSYIAFDIIKYIHQILYWPEITIYLFDLL